MVTLSIKIVVNSLGIVLNIAGAYLVFVNSPLKFTAIGGGDASTDWGAIEKRVDHENYMVKVGVYTLITGSVLQLISNFIA